jgi:hypothetical protein
MCRMMFSETFSVSAPLSVGMLLSLRYTDDQNEYRWVLP